MARSGALRVEKRKSMRLTPSQKELVVQTFFALGSYNATAKKLGINYITAKRIIKEAHQDPNLMASRLPVLSELAGKVHGKTEEIIESITPEELETKHERVYDAAGNLLRVVTTGPSLRDKAFAVGTLIDRQKVLEDTRAAIKNPLQLNAGESALVAPGTIEETVRLIAAKVKRLRIFDVEFDSGETGANIRKELNKYGITEQEIEDADLSDEPFD